METPSPQSPASGRGSEREEQLSIPAGEGANESRRELRINETLAGLRILVTRPREQAVSLSQRIELAGGIPLLFPLLDIAPALDAQALHEQVSRLAQFDLAIFISPNAVHYGMAAIRAALSPSPSDGTASHSTRSPKNGDQFAGFSASVRGAGGEGKLALPPTLKIAAVGQGSAKALRDLGISEVIAPAEQFDSEGLLAVPELRDVAGWRVMIFRGDRGRELLGDTLRARGANIEYAACYRRSNAQGDVKALLEAAPDAITVTSSEALCLLSQLVDSAPGKGMRAVPIFVPHPRIAELARQQGWKQVQLTESGDDGLLSALIAWNRSAGD